MVRVLFPDLQIATRLEAIAARLEAISRVLMRAPPDVPVHSQSTCDSPGSTSLGLETLDPAEQGTEKGTECTTQRPEPILMKKVYA